MSKTLTSEEKPKSRNYVPMTCPCGRIIRASPTTAQVGGIQCLVCGKDFAAKVRALGKKI
jgi:hypothetical protein